MPGHAIVQGLERRAPGPVAGQVVTAAAFSPRFDVARQLLLPAATLPSFTSSGALIAALIVIAASSEAMAGGTSRGLLAVSATVAPTAEVTTLDAVTVARHDAAAVILTAGDSRSPVRCAPPGASRIGCTSLPVGRKPAQRDGGRTYRGSPEVPATHCG